MDRPNQVAGTSICLLGLGGAGLRVLARAGGLVPGTVRLAAADTDTRALEACAAPTKVRLGAERTGGLGCGGDPAVGRLCVEDALEKFRALAEGRRLVILVVGLGGGLGSGGASTVLRAARDAGAMTLAVALYPFKFEGEHREAQAHEGLAALHAVADGVVVLAQERLMEQVGVGPVAETFARADGLVAGAVAALCNLLLRPGYLNLDFGDLEQIVKAGGGACALGVSSATGVGRAALAAALLLEGPMLEKGQLIAGAGAMLVGILGGPDLTVGELGEIMTPIQALAGKECRMSMGTFVQPEGEAGMVTVVALVSESWVDAGAVRAATVKPMLEGEKRRKRAKTGMKESERQALLGLDQPGKGRFKNVAPTILDGEDIDVPTYVRRGIELER